MKKILLLLAGLSMFSSCYDDFLTRESMAMTNMETIFKSSKQTSMLLQSSYNVATKMGAYDRNFWVYGDLMSGDSEEGGNEGCSDLANYRVFHRFTVNSANSQVSDFYKYAYDGANYATMVIDGIKNSSASSSFSEADRKQLMAEAKFLRAMYYFDLVRVFGPVMYFDVAPTYKNAKEATNRSAAGLENDPEGTVQVAMIYDNIIADLRDAIAANMASNRGDNFASHDGARGLLAKVLMYKPNRGEAEYREALQICQELIAERGDLQAKYPDIYAEIYENDPATKQEILIAFPHTATGEYDDGVGSIRPIDQSPRYVKTGKLGDPKSSWTKYTTYVYYGLNTPTQDLVNQFDVDAANKMYDPRLQMIAKGADALYPGQPCDSMPWKDAITDRGYGAGHNKIEYFPIVCEASQTGYYLRKSEPRRGVDEFPSNPQSAGVDNIVLRYADIILLGAEAAMELNDGATALKYVNMIRKRARQSWVTGIYDVNGKVIGVDGDGETSGKYQYGESTVPADLSSVTIDDIRNERRRELFCEANRFFDLVRWGIQDEVLGDLTTDGCGVSIQWHSYNKYLPFPLTQVSTHGGNLVQNVGY